MSGGILTKMSGRIGGQNVWVILTRDEDVINSTDSVVFLDHQELSPMHPNGWRRTMSGVHTNQNISKVSPSLLEVPLDNVGAGLSEPASGN